MTLTYTSGSGAPSSYNLTCRLQTYAYAPPGGTTSKRVFTYSATTTLVSATNGGTVTVNTIPTRPFGKAIFWS